MSMAQVQAYGRLTRDPEAKTVGEYSVTQFSIAVNRRRKDSEEASFFDCEAWGKTAEAIASHFVKGKEIIVLGELVQDRWTADDGSGRSKVKIKVDRFSFVGSKADSQTVEAVASTPKSGGGGDDHDGIPF